MAKQSMNPVPYLKHMEAYNDFSGGLNTVASDDNLKDNEFTDLVNVDLAERGPAKRRTGMSRHLTAPVSGMQGYFRYFKADGTMEEILAANGKLYKNGVQLPITGLASFQTTRQVEAVQYNDKLYIATGTKFVQYDGTTAAVVTPYRPEALEVLYIGTNALADDPNNFISDSTSAYLQITGVTVQKRYGIANKNNSMTAYVAKPATGTPEFKWEYRRLEESTWTTMLDFSPSYKTIGPLMGAGDYEIRCTGRMVGETDPVNYAEYRIPKYSVKETDQNRIEDTSTIHQCNRILLHWERVILYGDPNQKDMIYISDVSRPDYVPTLNTLRFENTENEELTALVKFRDMVVAFTPHTIQGLYGKSPYDYSRMYLSTSVGCIAPYSAQVFENYIGFLSLEGVYILKSVGYSESRINVQKIDSSISNVIPRDKDACACVADGQYQLVFPSKEKRFRFYYQRGVWTKDESPKLTFSRMYEFSGEVFGQASDGVLKMDNTVYDDDGYVYTDRYVFKEFDFDAPYNPKKLKELQILLGQTQATNLSLWVYADGASIINPDTSYASVNELGEVVWNDQATPNITIQTGTVLGSWIMGSSPFGSVESGIYYVTLSGKCRKVRLEIEHNEATPNTVLGLGFIYKLRKP